MKFKTISLILCITIYMINIVFSINETTTSGIYIQYNLSTATSILDAKTTYDYAQETISPYPYSMLEFDKVSFRSYINSSYLKQTQIKIFSKENTDGFFLCKSILSSNSEPKDCEINDSTFTKYVMKNLSYIYCNEDGGCSNNIDVLQYAFNSYGVEEVTMLASGFNLTYELYNTTIQNNNKTLYEYANDVNNPTAIKLYYENVTMSSSINSSYPYKTQLKIISLENISTIMCESSYEYAIFPLLCNLSNNRFEAYIPKALIYKFCNIMGGCSNSPTYFYYTLLAKFYGIDNYNYTQSGINMFYQVAFAGTPYYQNPTPKDSIKIHNLDTITINISDGMDDSSDSLDNCFVEINGESFEMIYSNDAYTYIYNIPSSSSPITIEFQVIYNQSSTPNTLEKRTITVYNSSKPKTIALPSLGLGSIVALLGTIMLFI